MYIFGQYKYPMKKLLLLFSFAVLAACEPEDYDGGTRFVIDLDVVDRNGNPLPGQHVFVRQRENWFGDMFDTIDEAVSDANGHVKMIFPGTRVIGNFQIGCSGDETFQKRIHRNLKKSDFPGYVYRFSEFELYRNDEVTTLRIVPEQLSEATLVTFSIEGQTADIFFGEWSAPLNAPPEDFYRVFQNSALTLRYTLEQNGVRTDYSAPIIIFDAPVTYNLEY